MGGLGGIGGLVESEEEQEQEQGEGVEGGGGGRQAAGARDGGGVQGIEQRTVQVTQTGGEEEGDEDGVYL